CVNHLSGQMYQGFEGNSNHQPTTSHIEINHLTDHLSNQQGNHRETQLDQGFGESGNHQDNHQINHQSDHLPTTKLTTKEESKESKNLKNKDIYIVVQYLNEKTGKKFSPETSDTAKHINARLREGFTVDDCKKVIDNKVRDWLH